MADQLQLRGGTTAEHATFTGALREVTVDTDKDTVVVHDNATAGGHPLAKENLSNVSAATAATKLDGQTVKFGLGAAATPSVTFNGDLNTGVYSPGADQVAISTNGSGRLRVSSTGTVEIVGAGTIGSTQAVSFNGSAPVNSLVIDSSGRLGVGTSSPQSRLDLGPQQSNTTPSRTATKYQLVMSTGDTTSEYSHNIGFYLAGNNNVTAAIDTVENGGDGATGLVFATSSSTAVDPSERLRITADGKVGIGSTSDPGGYNARLWIDNTTDSTLTLNTTGSSSLSQIVFRNSNGNGEARLMNGTGGPLTFYRSFGNEAARIDTSGRLLVGTSSARSGFQISTGFGNVTPVHQFEFNSQTYNGLSITHNAGANSYPAVLAFGKSRGSSAGSYTAVASGDGLGWLDFYGADGTNMVRAATISAEVDGTPGTNDMPGRLVFSVTSDGASSPTERMRINNSGNVGIGLAYTGAAVRLVTKGNGTSSSGYAFEAMDSGENTLLYCRNDGYINTGTRAVSPYNNTTASAANVNLFSDGGLYRSTSSIRYKTDVETIENQYSDALLECRPVWYKSLCAGDNKEWGYWGFIAEEVAQIDPRLCFFKEEEDGTLEPEGVQYDRFVPHLLNLIKRQKEQIEAMEARLTALESA